MESTGTRELMWRWEQVGGWGHYAEQDSRQAIPRCRLRRVSSLAPALGDCSKHWRQKRSCPLQLERSQPPSQSEEFKVLISPLPKLPLTSKHTLKYRILVECLSWLHQASTAGCTSLEKRGSEGPGGWAVFSYQRLEAHFPENKDGWHYSK